MVFFFHASNLKTVISPRTEFHHAGLFVEGEVLDVDLAGGLVDGGWFPLHAAGVVERRFCRQRHLKVAVGAAKTKKKYISIHLM